MDTTRSTCSHSFVAWPPTANPSEDCHYTTSYWIWIWRRVDREWKNVSSSTLSSWISLIFEHYSWLAQLRPPWIRAPEDPTTPVIPPVTPRTAKFINESRYYTPKDPKFLDEYGKPLSDEASDHNRDPPPLYKKHPPEGGIKGWSSVAGACVCLFFHIKSIIYAN